MSQHRPLLFIVVVVFLLGQALAGAASNPSPVGVETASAGSVTSQEIQTPPAPPLDQQGSVPQTGMAEGASCPASTAGSRFFLPVVTRNSSAASIAVDPNPPANTNSRTAPSVLNGSVATNFAGATAFLYAGDHPIQTGMRPNTIDPQHAAVLRGRACTRDGHAAGECDRYGSGACRVRQ